MKGARSTALDRAIDYLAPSWSLNRARARALAAVIENRTKLLQRRFEGADRGRRTQGWTAIGGSANSELRGSLEILRNRCRDLRRNNPWAKSAIRKLTSNIVGRGVRPKFLHDSDKVVREVTELFATWADTTECDASGRKNWYSMQAGLVESMVEGGDALVRQRRRRKDDGLTVPLQLQLMEGDHLDTFRSDGFRAPRRDGNVTIQGVEFDRIGRRRGYWVFPEHPGDRLLPTSLESSFVPASNVLHFYREDRIGQVRGTPWGAPVILRLHDFDAYEDNEALRMVVATSFSAFVRDLTPDGSFSVNPVAAAGVTASENENELGQQIDELQAGTIEYLPPGKTIEFPTLPQNEGFEAYARIELRGIAKGFDVPYEVLTSDLSGVNFSTGRISFIDWNRDLEQWRDFILILHFCDPSLRWWIAQARIAGLIPDDVRWSWMPPRREMIDPRTEINAEIAMVRAGFKSLSQVIEGLGMDSRTVLRTLSKDLETARELGLVLATDGTQTQGPSSGNVNANGGGGSRGQELLVDRLLEILADDRGGRTREETALEVGDLVDRWATRELENGYA